MDKYKVVDTDNFDGDYPDEKWASPAVKETTAGAIAEILNEELSGPTSPRFFKVVRLPYTLRPGFEP